MIVQLVNPPTGDEDSEPFDADFMGALLGKSIFYHINYFIAFGQHSESIYM